MTEADNDTMSDDALYRRWLAGMALSNLRHVYCGHCAISEAWETADRMMALEKLTPEERKKLDEGHDHKERPAPVQLKDDPAYKRVAAGLAMLHALERLLREVDGPIRQAGLALTKWTMDKVREAVKAGREAYPKQD